MYSVTVSHHFMIAHSLVGAVFGPAQQLHGATYVVEAEFRRESLDADGIVCDIGRALELLKTVVAEFDYRNLDELAEFRGRNTTTEFLAGDSCGASAKERSVLKLSRASASWCGKTRWPGRPMTHP
jgi:6-pyruvoyltetrahydropterin/6-carboxytetrahydropterin synthase